MSDNNTQPQVNAIGLVPQERRQPMQFSLMPVGQTQPELTREQERVANEYGREILIIEADRKKAVFGLWSIGDIRNHASSTFQDLVVTVMEQQREIQDKEYAATIAQFNRMNIQEGAKDLLDAAQTGSTHIESVVSTSLDKLSAHEPNFLERLFGR